MQSEWYKPQAPVAQSWGNWGGWKSGAVSTFNFDTIEKRIKRKKKITEELSKFKEVNNVIGKSFI